MGVFRRDEPKRAEPSPFGVVRSITASARRLGKNQLTTLATTTLSYREWQREAWVGYDRVGEIHYGFSVVANTLSRIRIYAAAITTSDEVPVPLEQDKGKHVNSDIARDASKLMSDFVSRDFASNVRTFALNVCVPGECLLLDIGKDEPRWVVKSIDEIKVEPDRIVLVPRQDLSATANVPETRVLAKKKNGKWDRELSIGRIWRQHPRYSEEPDSSMKAVADPIEELMLLQRLVRSTTRSRLNNGLLFVPDGITTTTAIEASASEQTDESGNPTYEAAMSDPGNAIMTDLLDSALTPIEDEAAPSSVVPLVLTGAAEAGQAIRHIQMERSSDQWLVERSERALERVLQGIDIPKEIVTGLQNVKYSNAVTIDEDFWKSNIEPLALVFVDAITAIYLRPTLLALGHAQDDIERVTVWYDPAEIVTHPNHAEEATNGYDRQLLSGEAWRREHGFSELDKPDENELALQLLLSKGQIPDDVISTLLQLALPRLLGQKREENIENAAIPFPESAGQILNGPTSVPTETPEAVPPTAESAA